MLAFIKGLIPGSLLTWIVATVIGSNGSDGGILHIFRFDVAHHHLYWSWPLMFAATALAGALYLMTE